MRLVTLLLDDSGGSLDLAASVIGRDGQLVSTSESHWDFGEAISAALKEANILDKEGNLIRV